MSSTAMAILPVSLSLPTNQSSLCYVGLSSFSSVTDRLSFSLSTLYLHRPDPQATKPFTVRMGGGPRTFPGGVSKWQWKRMQKKKAKQLLKARLMRERQIYEMRKRSELKAAVSELERPWEVVEQAAPNLFSVGADEQVKVLADRFQKPGGFDMWTEKDGPQLFEIPDGLPTARFFPKGVVHSIKPYGRVDLDGDLGEIEDEARDLGRKSGGRLIGGLNLGIGSGQERGQWSAGSRNSVKQRRPEQSSRGLFSESKDSDGDSSRPSNSRSLAGVNPRQSGKGHRERNDSQADGSFRKNRSTRSVGLRDANGTMKKTDSRLPVSSAGERRNKSRMPSYGNGRSRQDNILEKRMSSPKMEDVFDMSLQRDGSYSLDSS